MVQVAVGWFQHGLVGPKIKNTFEVIKNHFFTRKNREKYKEIKRSKKKQRGESRNKIDRTQKILLHSIQFVQAVAYQN